MTFASRVRPSAPRASSRPLCRRRAPPWSATARSSRAARSTSISRRPISAPRRRPRPLRFRHPRPLRSRHPRPLRSRHPRPPPVPTPTPTPVPHAHPGADPDPDPDTRADAHTRAHADAQPEADDVQRLQRRARHFGPVRRSGLPVFQARRRWRRRHPAALRADALEHADRLLIEPGRWRRPHHLYRRCRVVQAVAIAHGARYPLPGSDHRRPELA